MRHLFALVLAWVVLGLVWMMACILVGQFVGGFLGLAIGLAVLSFGLMVWKLRLAYAAIVILGGFAVAMIYYYSLRPRNDRDWVEDTSRLPKIEIESNRITVEDLRDFRWSNSKDYTAAWKSEQYDLSKLNLLELIVEPFKGSERAAHVFLSFGFSDGKRLAVSVEARRPKGRPYTLLAGASRQFELIYVFAAEEDIVDLRSTHRETWVCAYSIRVTPGFMKSLLLDLCQSANDLHETPRFYATIRDNCTTTLLKHANDNSDQKVGFQYEVLFPAQSGKLLHRLGLMDTELEYEEARVAFRITGPRRANEDSSE